jgi:hypothetical protein
MAAAAAKGLLRQAPMFLLAMQVPTGVPEVLLGVRTGYVGTTALIVVACWYVGRLVKAADDRTVIWVPRPTDAAYAQRQQYAKAAAEAKGEVWRAPPPPSPWIKTTYLELEGQKATEWATSSAKSAAFAFFLSLQMGIHVVLVVNLLTAFMSLWRHPLVAKHVFKQKAGEESEFMDSSIGTQLAVLKRQTIDPKAAALAAKYVWGEKLREPKTAPQIVAEKMTACVVRAWDDAVDCDFSSILELVDAHGADVNLAVDPAVLASASATVVVEGAEGAGAGVGGDGGGAGGALRGEVAGWTALMVAAGMPVDNARVAVSELLELPQLRLEQRDATGWTALHWAAYHDNAAAAKLICAEEARRRQPVASLYVGPLPLAVPPQALAAIRDGKNKTARDVALDCGHTATANAIRSAPLGRRALPAKAQRKATASSVESID